MKVAFLGTNGWYDTETGNTPSVFIETKTDYIILDAGFGFYKAKDLVKSQKPASLFLSHFHLDHIIGLHTLGLFRFSQGLDIYTPPGGEKVLSSFMKKPFTAPLAGLLTKTRCHDISKKEKLPFGLKYARLRHSVPCYGYRFEIEGRVVAYCTDTGVCGNLKRLAKGADLMITECAMAPDDKGINFFHMTPVSAARVADQAGVKNLALFHFDPGNYPSIESRKSAECAARKIFPGSIAANDGTTIIL